MLIYLEGSSILFYDLRMEGKEMNEIVLGLKLQIIIFNYDTGLVSLILFDYFFRTKFIYTLMQK